MKDPLSDPLSNDNQNGNLIGNIDGNSLGHLNGNLNDNLEGNIDNDTENIRDDNKDIVVKIEKDEENHEYLPDSYRIDLPSEVTLICKYMKWCQVSYDFFHL